MPGLLVVGLTHAADPGPAAAAMAAALTRAERPARAIELFALGDRDAGAAFSFPSVASPAVAAHHAGVDLDPVEVLGVARDAAQDRVGVVAVPGGLLALITARYSTRDLARELGFPVVLAVPSTPDAVPLARHGLESARAAGLAVVAVVLTRWPAQPDRVMLDERRVLEEVARVPVVALGPDPDAARPWPVADWLEAEPPRAPAAAHEAQPAAAAAPAAPIVLDPYVEWEAAPQGDPRTTPRPRIMQAMLEIVAAEGPMLATRAYALYNRASGGKKLTTIARAPLSSAIHWLAQERKIVLVKRDEIPWQDDDMVRMPDHPPVRVRELGPRTLDEVPLDEIAELMRRIRAGGRGHGGEEMKREILRVYGLVRLTGRADEYLGLALGLLD